MSSGSRRERGCNAMETYGGASSVGQNSLSFLERETHHSHSEVRPMYRYLEGIRYVRAY